MCPYFEIFGHKMGTYGLFILLGVFTVFLLGLLRGRKHGLAVEDLLLVGSFAFGLALIGGSVLYILVTYPIEQILAFIQKGDLRFLSAGLVFYGGLLGGVAGSLIGIRVSKCDFVLVEDSVVPFIPLGHAIGRMGCVMAGCCYGFPYAGPFALYYPNAISGLSPEQGYFPVQILEALINIGICLWLLYLGRKRYRATFLLFWYLALYAVSRFFLEMLRGDAIRGVWHTVSTSQMISIVLFLVSIAGMYRGYKLRAKEKM